jgi:hypothetical protein
MLEEAIPISVSAGKLKSAKEVFSVNSQEVHSKEELSKEEKRKQRAQKKRKIHTHLINKATSQKEKRRAQGMAQVDRFEQKQMDKTKAMKKMTAKAKEGIVSGLPEAGANSKGSMKSAKFFK